MAAKREKSQKYAGVYWREVDRFDGRGSERVYYIVYRRGGRGAKQIEEPVGRSSAGMTEARASQERARRISGAEMSNSEARRTEINTFGDLFAVYCDEHQGNVSLRDDRLRYNSHIRAALHNKSCDEITTADIAKIRKACEKRGLSPQTVKHVLTLIRKVLRYGAKSGRIATPEIQFNIPQVDNKKTEDMTHAQLSAYWQALLDEPDQHLAAFLKIALLTGMRRGALFGLRWQDIDFERRQIRLDGQSAKSGKSSYIPMNDAAAAVLASLDHISDYVWPGIDGKKRVSFVKMARRARDKAGLPADFRPLHGLRHVFASQLASSGQVDLYCLQRLLTHSSPQMTQRYAHLRDEALQRAASVANGLIPDMAQASATHNPDKAEEATNAQSR